MSETSVDYLVIGSGSAGAIVAARLSEDEEVRVMLLEAGPAAKSVLLNVPAVARFAFNAPRYNWNYRTEPEPHLGGRVLVQPRGRVLGGSSSINGMVYLRGNPLDFEAWSKAGATGWSYADVLPYFKKLEGWVDPHNEYQGTEGPVAISTPSPVNPIAEAFLKAGEQAGYPATGDVNGYQQEGFGRFPMNAANGYRSSTARAYLHGAADRPNLQIRTGIDVERIEFEGKRACAATWSQSGENQRIAVRREIVLCAGAFNSPKLLKLSGIGPAAELREHGIDVIQELPGVGENLMDHQISTVQMECVRPVSLAKHLGLFAKGRAALQWALTRRGLLASNHFQCGAFIRSGAGVKLPDIQLYLFPIAVMEGSKDFFRQHGFQVQLSPQRSRSRGWVRLRSARPADPPKILFNFMSHARDWDEMRKAFRLTREILAQPAMGPYRGREMSPGPSVSTDEQIDAYIRDHMHSSYHPCGTCKMGTDRAAVVDAHCRVHGVDGLRVVDASIMPSIPGCNLNAPTMMIGEMAADLIRGQKLPAENRGFFVDTEWRTRQRPGKPAGSAGTNSVRTGVTAPDHSAVARRNDD